MKQYLKKLALAGVGLVAFGMVMAAEAEIIWHDPVVDDTGQVIYEEGPYAVVPPPVVVEQESLSAPAADGAAICAAGESRFLTGWLATGPKAQSARPLIVVVIDDMGLDRKRSAAVMQLQGRLTLAFLPYARHVQEQADAARARGHTVMMHVPMQPENEGINPGPNVLRGDLGAAELRRRIAVNLNSFTGYTGINNHMGSRFSQDRAGLDVLMPELAARGLFFLDSRTHPLSAAETAAVAAHVPAAHRDVFLDHVETPEAVARALVQTERHAKRYGSAIAIGHPKDVTIGGLESWLPHLQAKGFELVTLDELLRRRRLQVQQAVALTPDARR